MTCYFEVQKLGWNTSSRQIGDYCPTIDRSKRLELIFLDSDVLIEILNKNSQRSCEIFLELEKYAGEDVVTSALVLEEVFFGILKVTPNPEKLKDHPILEMPIIGFTKHDAILAAEIEYEMEKLGKKRPRVNSLIASTVINHKSILFTFNIKHYEDIKLLDIISLDRST